MSLAVANSHLRGRTLKKHEILRGYQRFNRVMTEGKSLSGGHLRCFVSVLASEGEFGADTVKVGFTVSRKIRKPTARNRVKRLMREVYRMHKGRLHQLAIGKSLRLELVLVFRGDTAREPKGIPYDLIEKDFLRIIDRIERSVDGLEFV